MKVRIGKYLLNLLSLAGIALAVRACWQIQEQRWGAGLQDAGRGIYLVLAPFVDVAAFRRLLGSPVLASAKDPSLRTLPSRLRWVQLLGGLLLLAGIACQIAADLRG